MKYKIKTIYSIGVHIWGNALDMVLNAPDVTKWGWEVKGEGLSPVWSKLPDLWKSAKELIHCGCKSSVNLCGRKCKCRMSDPPLPCTALCFCEGDCEK